jgi:hypothetical protein
VVGRLTARHGIHVRLIQRAEGGLCASVLVPAGLVNIADPGQTVSIDLPAALQGNAPEWPSEPGAPASWPSVADTPMAAPAWPAAGERPAPATTSSWLVGAAGADSAPVGAGERSMAAGWLGSAKKAESVAGGPADLPDPPAMPVPGAASRRESTRRSEDPAAFETNAAGLPVRGRRTGRTGSTAGEPEQANGTQTAASDESNAAGLPVRVPGAASRPAEPSWLDSANGAETASPDEKPATGQRSMAAGWLKAAREADAGETPATDSPESAATTGAHALADPASEAGWQSASGAEAAGVDAAEVSDAAGWQSAGGAEGGAPGSAERSGWASSPELGSGAEATEVRLPASEEPSGANGWQSAGGAEGGEPGSGTEAEAAERDEQPVGAEAAVAGTSVAGDAAGVNGGAVGQEAGRAGGPVGHYLPGEVFEPVEVAGRLESAGIIVTLPDLPAASTPASILFADSTMGGDDGQETSRFTWLRNQPGAGAQEPVAGIAPVAPVTPEVGPAGLPKRVPKSQLLASKQPPPASAQNRNAVRARGFLSGFQAGIRQGENREGETGS